MMVLSILAALAAPQAADPLAPAREGKMQCYAPDIAAKTCKALAGYELQPDGSYANTALVLLGISPVITMETVTDVIVRDDAVCGYTTEDDLRTATIRVDGAPMTGAPADSFRDQLVSAMSSAIGPEICTRYLPDGDRLRTEITYDGEVGADTAIPVIWVSPEDGYRVAP
ncbi:hypothetical protein [Stakelama tenebrarum]|uniref:Uncharacterized protein n=1 Tax=Stakelama tenebrarum TaxID=2711215 RepID=A0A6G6Y1G3_9SPHN|nr:hypothetical protein [Sphingosinithalassobacter tenebrarum]QIG78558.1 hypothetical protein G5C33_01300 [Sphingosinithalassobacter tenebrarum]